VPGHEPRPVVGAWVLDYIAFVVATGWVGTLIYDAINVPYSQPASVHLLMVGVSGSLFGFRMVTRNGGSSGSGKD
jgi:hypothetical protein